MAISISVKKLNMFVAWNDARSYRIFKIIGFVRVRFEFSVNVVTSSDISMWTGGSDPLFFLLEVKKNTPKHSTT